MGELAMIANDATKSDDDRTAYNEEYKVLYKFINDSITKHLMVGLFMMVLLFQSVQERKFLMLSPSKALIFNTL